ncbi:MAG: DinB family protein [Kiloniellales bacterium]|nr:DinB family protein [Kiloniellales bacterium]
MIEHFRMLAGFNRWANDRVYDAAAALGDADYHKTRACAFFGSIHGTLNHLLVVDRLWFGRLAGSVPPIASLDETLYDDFAGLRAAREAEDARIIAQVGNLEEADLSRDCRFTLLSQPGAEKVMKPSLMLATVFNHQTHHRGQVHAMLKEAGVEPPGLDIILYPEASG